jgi:hypothetical protein
MTARAPDTEPLPPDDAFALLGDETRVEVLRVLGAADGPLSFSALYDSVAVDDSGQFNYHLEKLVGHFVRKTEEGYTLRRMGRRVVEAVLSGAVTETPTLDRRPVDETCEYCGGDVEISWESGSLRTYCTECAGRYGREYDGDGRGSLATEGYLGRLPLPPAGVRDRSPTEAFHAAWTWANLEVYAVSTGLCPRCSATVDASLSVCPDHDAGDGVCPTCESVYALNTHIECTNCIYKSGGAAVLAILAETELLDFLTDHGLNPVAPVSIRAVNAAQQNYEEEILARDPLRARLTFTIDDDTLAVTIDEDLTVVETERS